MFSVLVVDDEELMRIYLSNAIPSLCSDYRVTGIATDGIEALELFKRQKFDLVITDIRMPEMDGLSFAKYIYETSSDTKIIIISGYNDFEYARQSIKFHVYEYILKPINDDNLLDILLSLKETFLKEKNTKTNTNLYTTMNDYDLQGEFLSSLITSDTALSYKLYALLDSRGIIINAKYSHVAIITLEELDLYFINDSIFDIESNYLKLGLICKKYLSSKNYISYFNNENYTYFIISNENNEIKETLKLIYSELSVIVSNNNLPKIKISCGTSISDIMNAGYSASSAEDNFCLTIKHKDCILFPTVNKEDKQFIIKLKNICTAIYTDIISSSIIKLQSDVSEYCTFFETDVTVANILYYCSYILKYIYSRTSIKPKYIREAYVHLKDQINNIISKKTLTMKDSFKIIIDSISTLTSCENIATQSEPNILANQAKQYILSHYQEQISLSQISDFLNINNCYLSDLLHKTLGESYSSYLLKVRMEHAAQILRSSVSPKIYEVATKVGFISSKHFIAVFKKYYGITPSKYKLSYTKL